VEEGEVHVTDRPIALLGDDDLGLASHRRVVTLVHLLAIDEQHDVAVLLDAA
jgi:hypothetical protein